MGNIVKRESAALDVVSAEELETIQRVAKLMSASGFFETAGNEVKAIAQVATKILAGRELGFGPWASVAGIHVVQGKPVISANLMAAAIKAHPRYDYRVRKMAADEVAIEFFEDGRSLGVSRFSMADAKAAGLTNRENWKKYARNMLFARAMSNGVRWFCPDVFSGNAVYVPGELDEEEDLDFSMNDVPEIEVEPVRVEDSGPPPEPEVQEVPDSEPEPGPEPAVEDDPFSTDYPADWMSPNHAIVWAIEVGACANEYEARNSWKKVVRNISRTGKGTITADQLPEAFARFYRRQLEKLEDKEAKK